MTIITQIPTMLEASPLYLGHYGIEDDGLTLLSRDIEDAHSFINGTVLWNRQEEFSYLLNSGLRPAFPLESMTAFERLLASVSSGNLALVGILWLMQLNHNLLCISKKRDIRELKFILQPSSTGAHLASARHQSQSPSDHRSERIRHIIQQSL